MTWESQYLADQAYDAAHPSEQHEPNVFELIDLDADGPERGCDSDGCMFGAEVCELQAGDAQGYGFVQMAWCMEHAIERGYAPPAGALMPGAEPGKIADAIDAALSKAEHAKSLQTRARAFGEAKYWVKVLRRQAGRAA
jgi:hypothetical protein